MSASHSAFRNRILDASFLKPALAERVPDWERRIGSGDIRPLLFFRNPEAFTACLVACWRKGLVPVLLPDDRPATVARFADGTLLSDAGEYPRIRVAKGETGPETALILSTSGSTGLPKPVAKTFAQLEREVRALESVFGTRVTGRKLLSTVSHQHIYGLLFTVLWPLAFGRDVAASRCFFPEELDQQLAGGGEAVLVSSPAHAHMLMEFAAHRDPPGHPHRAPLAVFSSGGRLDSSVAGALAGAGVDLAEIYGSTETGGIAWRKNGETASWKPLPGVDYEARKGELWVRSPWCEPVEGGWIPTRDRVALAAEGFMLLGRSDRIVKVAEKRVSLDELDAVLRGLPGMRDARSFLPPRRGGPRDEVYCLAELNAEGEARLASVGLGGMIRSLRRAASARLEPVALPRHWRFARLPFNAQGKLLQSDLLSLFGFVELDGLWAKIQNREPGKIEAELFVDPDYPRLQGHFPGHPVVPGVCQTLWARALARMISADDITRVENLKFHAILRPGRNVAMRVEVVAAGKWTFRIQDAERKYSSGRLFA